MTSTTASATTKRELRLLRKTAADCWNIRVEQRAIVLLTRSSTAPMDTDHLCYSHSSIGSRQVLPQGVSGLFVQGHWRAAFRLRQSVFEDCYCRRIFTARDVQ